MISSNPESYVICILSKNVLCASLSFGTGKLTGVHDVDWLVDRETNLTYILFEQKNCLLSRKNSKIIVSGLWKVHSHLRGWFCIITEAVKRWFRQLLQYGVITLLNSWILEWFGIHSRYGVNKCLMDQTLSHTIE
jgi:hypothetical protein